jgi:hypothetical protein
MTAVPPAGEDPERFARDVHPDGRPGYLHRPVALVLLPRLDRLARCGMHDQLQDGADTDNALEHPRMRFTPMVPGGSRSTRSGRIVILAARGCPFRPDRPRARTRRYMRVPQRVGYEAIPEAIVEAMG